MQCLSVSVCGTCSPNAYKQSSLSAQEEALLPVSRPVPVGNKILVPQGHGETCEEQLGRHPTAHWPHCVSQKSFLSSVNNFAIFWKDTTWSSPNLSPGSASSAPQHSYTAEWLPVLACVSPKIRMSSLVVKSSGDMLNYSSDIIFTFFQELSIFQALIFCAVLRKRDQKLLCQLQLWQKCQEILEK